MGRAGAWPWPPAALSLPGTTSPRPGLTGTQCPPVWPRGWGETLMGTPEPSGQHSGMLESSSEHWRRTGLGCAGQAWAPWGLSSVLHKNRTRGPHPNPGAEAPGGPRSQEGGEGARQGGLGPWRPRSREAVSQPGRTPPTCPHQGSTRARVTAKGSASPLALSKHWPPCAQSSRGRLRPSSSALPQGLWAPTLPDLHPVPARTLQHGEAGQLPASHLAPWGQLSTPSVQTPGAPQYSAQGQGNLVIRHRTDHL